MGENCDGRPERPPSGYWSMHPQTHLGSEILPYLRELDDHEWTAEEREFLEWAERRKGRPHCWSTCRQLDNTTAESADGRSEDGNTKVPSSIVVDSDPRPWLDH